MRSIGIDIGFVLSVLGTENGCATWVNIPEHEVPLEIQVAPLARNIRLKIIYPHERNAIVVDTPDSHFKVFVCSCDAIITGAHLRVDHFHRDLDALLHWLRVEQGRSNIAKVRDNYRVVGAILRTAAHQLFLPPQ